MSRVHNPQIRSLLAVLLIAYLVQGCPVAAAQGKHFDQWLEEVTYIISQEEKERFLQLPTDHQRLEFIREFWKRRDPDPGTELNESEREHYRRLEYANKHFSHGKHGWRTDRGRIYILYGEPDERLVFSSSTIAVSLDMAPYKILKADVPEMEIWTYNGVDVAENLRGTVSLVFLQISVAEIVKLFSLSRSLAEVFLQPAMMPFGAGSAGVLPQGQYPGQDFHLVYAGPPQFSGPESFYSQLIRGLTGPFGQLDRFELVRNVSTVLRSGADHSVNYDRERQNVKGEVATGVFFDKIPLTLSYWFFRSADGYTHIPFALHIPGNEVENVDELTFVLEMRRGDQTVAHVTDTLSVQEQNRIAIRYDGLTYQGRLAVFPGVHELNLYVVDRRNARYNHLQQEVAVPDLGKLGFSVSDLVLCKNVKDASEARKFHIKHDREWLTYSEHNPLKADEFLFLPAVDRKFRRKDLITVFFEVYEPELVKGQPDVDVQVHLQSLGNAVTVWTSRHHLDYLTTDELRKITYAFSFSLSRLMTGRYRLQVRVHDLVSGKEGSREKEFEVF